MVDLAHAVVHTKQAPGADVLTALLGGAVGVALTAAARAIGIPFDLRRHNAAVADRDDQLATWVADRDRMLEEECQAIRIEVMPGKVRPDPGALATPEEQFKLAGYIEWLTSARAADQNVADARAHALHQYRDEARRAHLDVATTLATEGWAHHVWRWLSRNPSPVLCTPDNASAVLDSWRQPTNLNGEKAITPEDATRRTLDDAIRQSEQRWSGP